jgi:hypothetical protein
MLRVPFKQNQRYWKENIMENNLNNPALAHGIGAVIVIVLLGIAFIELIVGIF